MIKKKQKIKAVLAMIAIGILKNLQENPSINHDHSKKSWVGIKTGSYATAVYPPNNKRP